MVTQQWHLLVSGRVQGVFYRGSTQQTAQSLGLTGWVRNLSDGRVEIVAEGEPEQLQKLYDWCHAGPIAAKVSGVERQVTPASGRFPTFDVVRTG
ncbi:MAG: acylphosphatase [Natronospirillum sp.]|uniref:acylphosphatase n=1 Tax=Natronospirillum sp. TaxID=2812955 RepID=UPI0025F0064A|nr:acylphosphatase [Natronospirillum sp.]MCH8553347.1 acylphosphatase [Natronospirillum sp.]